MTKPRSRNQPARSRPSWYHGVSSRSQTACSRLVPPGLRGLAPRASLMPQSADPDHDQRLKVLLKEFFQAFFDCFFPAWAARFEFLGIDWLDKELFLAPRRGSGGSSTWWPA